MKSKRLTISMRDDLVDAIVRDSFVARESEIKKLKVELADACYRRRFTKLQEKAMREFSDSEKVFYWADSIACYFGGEYGPLLPMSEKRPFWYEKMGREKYSKEDPLTLMWKNITSLIYSLGGDKQALSREIRGVISSCNTTKQLLEHWPECEKWVKALGLTDEPAPVPMKSPVKINELLCNYIGKDSPTCKE